MKNHSGKWLRSAFLVLLAAFCQVAAADFSGKVVGVSDGDTLSVMRRGTAVKVRIAGIDAPERNQPWGQQSKQALASTVFGRTVEIDQRKKDRYGRTLGRVLIGGEDVGLQLIRKGFAWHYRQYARDQPATEAQQYAHAEKQARAHRAGLWRDAHPIPPWNWRRKH
ncbi:thermonuclease family protein [Uliginosibacterium paludis]|uniref:Thermonuclease family protein n=1 Tax=Uliginosibacterium paludis TaxID=1615952 RepID=A0ABV2CJX4_9RHOO